MWYIKNNSRTSKFEAFNVQIVATAEPQCMAANRSVLLFRMIYKRGVPISKVTRLWAGRPGFDSRQGEGLFFSLPPRLERFGGPPGLPPNGYRGLFLRG